eukprot:9485431-Pyramimonas_sp.AAC.2
MASNVEGLPQRSVTEQPPSTEAPTACVQEVGRQEGSDRAGQGRRRRKAKSGLRADQKDGDYELG